MFFIQDFLAKILYKANLKKFWIQEQSWKCSPMYVVLP